MPANGTSAAAPNNSHAVQKVACCQKSNGRAGRLEGKTALLEKLLRSRACKLVSGDFFLAFSATAECLLHSQILCACRNMPGTYVMGIGA